MDVGFAASVEAASMGPLIASISGLIFSLGLIAGGLSAPAQLVTSPPVEALTGALHLMP